MMIALAIITATFASPWTTVLAGTHYTPTGDLSDRPVSDPSYEPLVGVTAPLKRATLAAVMSARIARLLADEGAMVVQGEVVIKLDDTVQRAKVAISKAAAETKLGVELAQSEWNRTRAELKRLERLRSDASASTKELLDARSLEHRRHLEYELATFNQEQAVRAYEREKSLLERHYIRAPFTGHVVEQLKAEGETVDPLEGILTIVQLDPLLVTVDCPLDMVGTVSTGSTARLTPIGLPLKPRIGRVKLVSRMADAGSQTFRVKIEVDNDDEAWIAGMKVAVQFMEPTPKRAQLTGQQLNGASYDGPTRPTTGAQ